MTARTFSAVPRPSRRLLFPGRPPLRADVRSHGAAAAAPIPAARESLGSSAEALWVSDEGLPRPQLDTAPPTRLSDVVMTGRAPWPERPCSHRINIAARR